MIVLTHGLCCICKRTCLTSLICVLIVRQISKNNRLWQEMENEETSCLAEFYVVDWRLCFLISKYSILKLTLVRFSKTCDIPCIFQFYISNICSNIAKILLQLSKLAPGFAQRFWKFKWITIGVTLSAVNIIWHSHLWVNNS